MYVNVTCDVNTSDMSSKVALGYIGPHQSKVKVVQREVQSDNRNHRYFITLRQLMRLPSEGYIICSARGDVSGHEITEPILTPLTGDMKKSILCVRACVVCVRVGVSASSLL